MATTRQGNWLGQMRADVPDFRAMESAIANDFDLLAGKIMVGEEATIVRGFFIPVTNTVGNPATALTLNVTNGLVLHFNATEACTMLEVDTDRSVEALNNSNARVIGSFASAAVNYVGIDYTRYEDSESADVTKFLDPNTKAETERRVPKARVLDYTVIITTTPFSFNPAICPIAQVQTDSSGNVLSITDCRQLFFRLAPGGDTPNADGYYNWTDTNRRENSITYSSLSPDDPFSEGDKDITSLKQWMDAVMTVLWEAKSGESWYSPTSRDMIKLAYGNPPFVSTADNFFWDDTNSYFFWTSIKVLFENSSGSYYNDVFDGVSVSSISRSGSTVTVTTSTAHGLSSGDRVYLTSTDSNFSAGEKLITVTGTTTFTYSEAGTAGAGSGTFFVKIGAILSAGQCLYVDIDRKTDPGATVIPAVGDLQTLPSPVIPGSRIIIAWRVGTEIHIRDRAYPIGRFVTETKYPNVIVDAGGGGDTTSLSAALSLLPAYGGTIVMGSDLTISSTVTLPANVKLLGRCGVTLTLSGSSTELRLSAYSQLMDVRVVSSKTTGVLVRAQSNNAKINLCRFQVQGTTVCVRIEGNYCSCNMSEFDNTVSPSTGVGIQVAGGVTAFNEYDNTYIA